MEQPISASTSVAAVDEMTNIFHPRPTRAFNSWRIELATLERAQITPSTATRCVALATDLFAPVLERALEYYSEFNRWVPEIYHVNQRLREENGLDNFGGKFILSLPPLSHETFASGHAGPRIPPTTQLEALLDEHARGVDILVKRNVTEPAIRRNNSPSQQSALGAPAHQPSMWRFVAVPRQVALRSSGPVREAFDTHEMVADTNFEASRQPPQCVTPFQHITVQSSAPVRERRTAPQFVNEVDENRVRQDKGLPPLKQAHEQSKGAAKRQRRRERKSEEDVAIYFAQREDAKYAANDSAWDVLSSLHEENAAAAFETPMGKAFLRSRACASPGPGWCLSAVEEWMDEVDGDALEAYDDLSVSDEDHPGEDARIAEGIASGVTRVTPVRSVLETDPFLEAYPEYATNEQHWEDLSILHEEEEKGSNQGSEPTNEATAKAAEASESDSEIENQDANQAFFDIDRRQGNTPQPLVSVIIENSRSSLQSPQPGRSSLFASGFI